MNLREPEISPSRKRDRLISTSFGAKLGVILGLGLAAFLPAGGVVPPVFAPAAGAPPAPNSAIARASHRGPGLASYDAPGIGFSVSPVDNSSSGDSSASDPAASDGGSDAPNGGSATSTADSSAPSVASATLSSASASTVSGAPRRLRIPSLGIDTSVEAVGLTHDGALGIPSTPFVVAWYDLGPRPGDPGNAVIEGHLDHPGGPGVFWYLDELKAGDKVLVQIANGSWKTFVVVDSVEYPWNRAPLDLIFGPSSSANLNLITCEGTFDRGAHNYDHRRVVYTRLQK